MGNNNCSDVHRRPNTICHRANGEQRYALSLSNLDQAIRIEEHNLAEQSSTQAVGDRGLNTSSTV